MTISPEGYRARFRINANMLIFIKYCKRATYGQPGSRTVFLKYVPMTVTP